MAEHDHPAWRSPRRGHTAEEPPGKDIVSTGSITLVHELIRLGLVDEYRLFIYPVVLGQGRRLLENATSMLSLRVGELQRFGNGIALAIYRIN